MAIGAVLGSALTLVAVLLLARVPASGGVGDGPGRSARPFDLVSLNSSGGVFISTLAFGLPLAGTVLVARRRRRQAVDRAPIGAAPHPLQIHAGHLEARVKRLSRILEQSPASIVITDRDGNIEYVNARFELVTGYAREDAIGRNPRLLQSGKTPAHVYDDMWRTIQSGKEWRGELCNRTRTGEEFWESASISPLADEQGEITHFIAVKEDITERKRIADALHQSQKLESLGTLAGGIAHDFNNILAAIRGNAELAAVDMGDGHPVAESLTEILRASDRAAELVRRIMTFSRPKEPTSEVVDLATVVDEVMRLLRSTVPASVVLRIESRPGTPHVRADAAQVHEAIVNLTTNAVHAIGPRPGHITYTIEGVGLDAVHAGKLGVAPGPYTRLTVRDSGIGMDEATMARAFDVFFTTKRTGEGTGLGLSMVHGIVRSHGGAVTVTSAPGQGASFHLYFPSTDATVRPKGKPKAVAPVRGSHCILFVDDEPALVSLAERGLSRLGHDVTGFTNPAHALRAFKAEPGRYTVVVTDMTMPEMSGFDFVRAVRAIRPVPSIVLTGFLSAESESRAQAVGVTHLLHKPCSCDDLSVLLAGLPGGAMTGQSG